MYEKIKLNVSLRGYPKDSVIRIKVIADKETGILPEDIYWRNRYYDSLKDNCIEFVFGKEIKTKVVKKKVEQSKKDDDISEELNKMDLS